MANAARPSRAHLRVILPVLLPLLAVSSARADLRVVGPEEVLAQFVVPDGGTSFLEFDGKRWELITDASSPEVSQLGDGAFHPMSVPEIQDALAALGPVADRLDGTIVVLPYPRRESLKSSCEHSTVYLSPGIREVHTEHVHSTVIHEVGHLLQHTRAPEGSNAWSRYLDLRELAGNPAFHPEAVHRDRPTEIFAEDFRLLLGGPLATTAASHENADIAAPHQVPGLAGWLGELADRRLPDRTGAEAPTSFPNPFSGPAHGQIEIRFVLAGHSGLAATADVYDTAGRRVRTLRGSALEGQIRVFRWDGRDSNARRVGSGIYFVRWREDPSAGTARVQVLR